MNQGHGHTLHREHTHSHLSSRHRCMEHSLAMCSLKCDFGFGRCSDMEWSTLQNPVLFSIPVQGIHSSSRCTCCGTLSIPSRGAVHCIPPRNRTRTRAGLWTPLLPVYYKAESVPPDILCLLTFTSTMCSSSGTSWLYMKT